VGSVQSSATALPASAFVTDVNGSHTHTNGPFTQLLAANHSATTTGTDNTDPSGSEPDLLASGAMSSAGSHSHTVASGGDSETRPKNASVHFIIRY
jgi:hypothetical protein